MVVGGLVVEVEQAAMDGALLERLSVFARFEAGAQRLPVSVHRLVPTSLDISGLILAFALIDAEAPKAFALALSFGWDLGLGLAGHFCRCCLMASLVFGVSVPQSGQHQGRSMPSFESGWRRAQSGFPISARRRS